MLVTQFPCFTSTKVQILTPEELQLFVARSGRICHLVASLQGSGVQTQETINDSLNVQSLRQGAVELQRVVCSLPPIQV